MSISILFHIQAKDCTDAVGVLALFLRRGVTLDTPMKGGYLPVHLAVTHNKPLMLQRIIDTDKKYCIASGNKGDTPLHLSVLSLPDRTFFDLICNQCASKYAIVQKRNDDGWTVLHHAVCEPSMCKEVVEKLLPFYEEKQDENPGILLIHLLCSLDCKF